MKIEITLSDTEVKDLIINGLEKRNMEVIGNVELVIGTTVVGNQMNESHVPIFKHAKCKVEVKR